MFLRSALLSFGTSGLAVTPASTALAADAGGAGREASDGACAELPLDAREVPGDAADSSELPLAHCPCMQKQRAVVQDSGCMSWLMPCRCESAHVLCTKQAASRLALPSQACWPSTLQERRLWTPRQAGWALGWVRRAAAWPGLLLSRHRPTHCALAPAVMKIHPIRIE